MSQVCFYMLPIIGICYYIILQAMRPGVPPPRSNHGRRRCMYLFCLFELRHVPPTVFHSLKKQCVLDEFFPNMNVPDLIQFECPVTVTVTVSARVILHLVCLPSRTNFVITYRDLKVDNLLVGRDGLIKLCDFGSCSTTHRSYHGAQVLFLQR